MSILRLVNYLEHILEAMQRIFSYTEDITELTFTENKLIQDGVIRNLEVIGEACRNITRHYPDFAKQYPNFPLVIAYEMRNALIHGYFKIDLEIVWRTIEKELPGLHKQTKKLYKQMKNTKDSLRDPTLH